MTSFGIRLVSSLLQTLGLVRNDQILVIGLKNAGGANLVWRLAEYTTEYTKLPACSLVSVSRAGTMSVTVGNTVFRTLEVGGPDPNHQLRKELIRGARAVIFVVDATGIDFDEAAAELHALAAAPELQGVPFLVLGNECDVGRPVWSARVLSQYLRVEDIMRQTHHQVRAFPCTFKKGWGYKDGLRWLFKVLERGHKVVRGGRP